MLFSSKKQLLSAANVKEEGVGHGRFIKADGRFITVSKD